ncbi:MAG: hypothetical protein ACRDIE_12080, partial [Chloroflexota bacterium]
MKQTRSGGIDGKRPWDRDPARSVRAGLQVCGRCLSLLGSTGPITLIVVLVLGAALPLLPVLQAWLLKLIVDALTRAIRHVPGQGDAALALAFLYALTLLLPPGVGPLQQSLAARLRDRTVAKMDHMLMGAGRRLVDLVRIERPAFGDELETVRFSTFNVFALT